MLVPDLAAGIARVAGSPAGVNAVTPSGDRVTASGALLGGRDGAGARPRRAHRRGAAPVARRCCALAREVDAARAAAEAARPAARERGGDPAPARGDSRAAPKTGAATARRSPGWRRSAARHLVATLRAEASRRARGAALVRGADGARRRPPARRLLEREREALEEKAEEAARGYLALEDAQKVAAERRMEARLALADARARAEAAASACRARPPRRPGPRRARGGARAGGGATSRGAIDAAEVEVAEAQAARERDGRAAPEGRATLLVEARRSSGGARGARPRTEQRATAEVEALHAAAAGDLESCRR